MTTAYLPEQSAIYLADSLQMLPRLRPASVRLVLSDPPYNVSRKNNLTTMGRRGIEWKWDGEFDQLSWLPPAAEAIMPGGSIIIWNDWKNLGPIARFLEDRLGFDVKRELSWTKANPMPRNLDRSYVQSREYGLWAVKTSAKHPWVFNKRKGVHYERGDFNYPTQRSEHPSKKPNGLFQELIGIHTNPGDLVVDPFAGAGTTAIAAELSLRRHISFEKLPQFYNLAVKSIVEVVGAERVTHLRQPATQE